MDSNFALVITGLLRYSLLIRQDKKLMEWPGPGPMVIMYAGTCDRYLHIYICFKNMCVFYLKYTLIFTPVTSVSCLYFILAWLKCGGIKMMGWFFTTKCWVKGLQSQGLQTDFVFGWWNNLHTCQLKNVDNIRKHPSVKIVHKT